MVCMRLLRELRQGKVRMESSGDRTRRSRLDITDLLLVRLGSVMTGGKGL